MPNWDLKFKAEYDYARAQLAGDANFDRAWLPQLQRLRKLMAPEGFDAAEAAALDELRRLAQQGPGGVVNGQKNWTRIVVHELSHLAAGTEGVVNGDTRYADYGILRHSGYPGAEAVPNADNWAFFAADCAGALTDGERNQALRKR